MKAIQARYFGPTNTKGSRIKVWAEGNSAKWYSLDYSQNTGDFVEQCAKEYCEALQWDFPLASGQLANGDWVFCFVVKQ